MEHKPYEALKHKEFVYYLTGRFAYNFAFQMQNMILGWKIYEITENKLALGMIGLAEAIPFIIFSLFAGYFSDTYNRKNIIRFSIIGLIISTVLFYFLLSTRYNFLDQLGIVHLDKQTHGGWWYRMINMTKIASPNEWVMSWGLVLFFIIVGILGICRTFITAAYKGLYAQILPKDLYAPATTWDSITWQISAVSGPALGGLLLAWIGFDKAYYVIIFMFILSFIGFELIAQKPLANQVKEPIIQSLKAGLSFVFNTPILLGAITLDLFAVLFGGAIALLPVFVKDILHSGEASLGILRAAPFVGAALMGFFLTHHPPFKDAGKKLFISVALFGVCMIGFALSTNVYLSGFILFLSGAFDSVSVVIRSAIFQLYTPDEMRGRVSSVNSIFITSSNEIGSFESGLAADIMGTVPSVIFGGAMTLLVVAISSQAFKKLRNMSL